MEVVVEVVEEGVYLGVSGEKVNDIGDSGIRIGSGVDRGVGSAVSSVCSIVSVTAVAAVVVVLVPVVSATLMS